MHNSIKISMPNNHNCKICTLNCSKQMGFNDLCYLHLQRIAKKVTVKCSCEIEWDAIEGDATGRIYSQKYYNRNDFVIVDMVGHWCCSKCQNMESQQWRCGNMMICSKCKPKHKNSCLVELDHELIFDN